MTSAAAGIELHIEQDAHLHTGDGLIAEGRCETGRVEKAWGPAASGGQKAPSYMGLREAETEHGHGLN